MIDQIIDEIKMYRNVKKWPPKETIAERVKLLTLNKPWNRLPVLSAQIKAGNNSYKLKDEII